MPPPRSTRIPTVGPSHPDALTATPCVLEGEQLIVLSHPIVDPAAPELECLSQAERDVVRLVLEGLSQAQIATTRRTSPRTVAKQLESAYRRLGVGSRAELVARVSGGSRASG